MSKSSFSQWMAEQDESKSENHGQSSFPYFSNVFGQLSVIQDSVTNQFQDLSNSLPDAGMTIIFNYLVYYISNAGLCCFILFYFICRSFISSISCTRYSSCLFNNCSYRVLDFRHNHRFTHHHSQASKICFLHYYGHHFVSFQCRCVAKAFSVLKKYHRWWCAELSSNYFINQFSVVHFICDDNNP